jgi:hypothetical protein
MHTLDHTNEMENTAGEVPAVNSSVISQVNNALEDVLSDDVLTPQSGLQRIRKVLFRYRLDMPIIYELDSESDEIVIDVYDMEMKSKTNLYLIYSLNEEGFFEFYAELGTSERMEKLLSDEEEIDDN